MGELLDIEAVENSLTNDTEKNAEYLTELLTRFPDCGYLRVLLFEASGDIEILQGLVKRTERILLDEHELLPFCFAVIQLEKSKALDRAVVDSILSLNIERVRARFDHKEFPELFPIDSQGRPPPPRPRSKQPPNKPEIALERRDPKRALPGYTPGWMAAEYAKKHKI
jgi:hypothetical protein